MAWVVLVLSGLFEAVWATALSRIDSWERTGAIVVFGLGLAVSMAGLGWALRSIPVGTGYAVWVGIGATLTAAYAMATGTEPASVLRVLLLAGIVGCVIGLKLTH